MPTVFTHARIDYGGMGGCVSCSVFAGGADLRTSSTIHPVIPAGPCPVWGFVFSRLRLLPDQFSGTYVNIAVLLFEGVVALDAVGPYEVLSRLPGVHVDLVARGTGAVRCDTDFLTLTPTAAFTDVLRPDALVVPGAAHRIEDALADTALIEWLADAGADAQWIGAVGCGPLMLARAGLLNGRSVTAHWTALKRLESQGIRCSRDRLVTDGNLITASSSSAGIDLALHLAERLTDSETANALRLVVGQAPDKPEPDSWTEAAAHVRRKAEHLLNLNRLREEGRSAIRRLQRN